MTGSVIRRAKRFRKTHKKLELELCQDSLREMPHIFLHGIEELNIIKSIIIEFLSCVTDKHTTHPCVIHLQGATCLINNDYNLAQILMEVLMRFPAAVVKLTGKKLEARSRNECYNPTRKDILEIMQECKEAGVDPHSAGCSYIIAFFLKDKQQVLQRLDDEIASCPLDLKSYHQELQKLVALVENSEDCTFIYVGETLSSFTERTCGYAENKKWSCHFEEGTNGLIMELLQKEIIEGDVIAYPVINIPTSCRNRKAICRIVEAVNAAAWSLDKTLIQREGNSTNQRGCGGIPGGHNAEMSFNLYLPKLIEYKDLNGDCNVPVKYDSNPG